MEGSAEAAVASIVAACRHRIDRGEPVDAVVLDGADALDQVPGVPTSAYGQLRQATLPRGRRRQHGSHYTHPLDIRRVLDPLFLDDLRALDPTDRAARVAKIRVLDPACGCGDFLVEAHRALAALTPEPLDLRRFVGIEQDPVSAELARRALLAAHLRTSRGPPTATAIHAANALRVPWTELVPAPDADTFVVGNPPFVGKKEQTRAQKADVHHVWGRAPGVGVLDYVTAWFHRAAAFIAGTDATAAFVATSSITQGEQVGAFWRGLRAAHPVHLRFAHTPFRWRSDAAGRATVHVVILGFGATPSPAPFLVDHGEDPPARVSVRRLSPYLVAGDDHTLAPRTRPLAASTPRIRYGSFALDDGQLTLSDAEARALLDAHPEATPWVRPFVGGEELLTGRRRYCLWLAGVDPDAIAAVPPVHARVRAVADWRRSRRRARTVALAETPHLFAERRQPTSAYLAVPTASSHLRMALPVARLPATTIASNQIYVLAGADDAHLGVLSSAMHRAWTHRVAGRLGAGLRYSARIVYNNFPWPAGDLTGVAGAADAVLTARTDAPLGAQYTRPHAALVDAHRALDQAVDRCYRAQPFTSDRERVEHLLARAAALTR